MLPVLIIGAIWGGILTLVASGFTLTFGVGRIFNFAHGTFFAISAYVSYILYPHLGYLSVVVGILSSAILGLMLYFMVKPIRENEIMVILLTLSLALLIEQVILLTFGEDPVSIPPIFKGSLNFFGVEVTSTKLLSFIVAIILIVLLEFTINKTRIGKEISAVSQDYESAMIVGINVERVFMLTMLISSILAGIGGVLYAQIYSVNPESILEILIVAFAIVVLGGLGSVKGSIVSAFLISYIQTAVSYFSDARWSELASLLVIIAVLIVRPKGLFGVE